MAQNRDYLDYFVPKKNPKLVQVQKILKSPEFQTGKKEYAIRVFRNINPKSPTYYQNTVRADSLNQLRLKCIKYLPWDLKQKHWPTDVLIYRNATIDKYNHAGYMSPCYDNHSFFVWKDEVRDRPYDSKVDSRTGAITKQKFEQDTAIPYKPGRN